MFIGWWFLAKNSLDFLNDFRHSLLSSFQVKLGQAQPITPFAVLIQLLDDYNFAGGCQSLLKIMRKNSVGKYDTKFRQIVPALFPIA